MFFDEQTFTFTHRFRFVAAWTNIKNKIFIYFLYLNFCNNFIWFVLIRIIAKVLFLDLRIQRSGLLHSYASLYFIIFYVILKEGYFFWSCIKSIHTFIVISTNFPSNPTIFLLIWSYIFIFFIYFYLCVFYLVDQVLQEFGSYSQYYLIIKKCKCNQRNSAKLKFSQNCDVTISDVQKLLNASTHTLACIL